MRLPLRQSFASAMVALGVVITTALFGHADGKYEGMIHIPAGEFWMGSPEEGDAARYRPRHRVCLDAYHIDKHELTNKKYMKFVQATGKHRPRWMTQEEACTWGLKDIENYDQLKRAFEAPDHPVLGVGRSDAEAYCAWAGKRLPTEAEWEMAARGTDERKYPWGNETSGAGGVHRMNGTGAGDGFEYTAPVGSFSSGASPYGVMDMAGNVWEWVADWYEKDYYRRSPRRNPKGPAKGSGRIARGGAWFTEAERARADYRAIDHFRDGLPWCMGFRCAASIDSKLASATQCSSDASKPLSERLFSADHTSRREAREELGELDDEARKKLVPAIVEALRYGEGDVRATAAMALRKTGPPAIDAVPALIEASQAQDPFLRRLAIQALGKIAPAAETTISVLIRVLKDDHAGSSAAEVLGSIGPTAKDAVPALIEALRSGPRGYAAEALGNIGPAAEAAIPELIWVVRRTGYREQAADALVKIGPVAVPAVIKALGEMERDPNVRREFLKVLGQLGPAAKEAIPALVRSLEEDSIHGSAVWALGRIGPTAIPVLLEALKDEDFNRRRSVVTALGKMGAATVPALIRALRDGNRDTRDGAVRTLEDIGPPAKDAVPALIRALKDEDSFVRLLTADALASIGPAARDAVPALKQALERNEPDVRDFARKALRSIEDEEYALPLDRAADALAKIEPLSGKEDIPALVKDLQDENWHVRSPAVRSLSKFGPAAVPVLALVLRDRHWRVRSSAARTLEWMGLTARAAVPALGRAIGDPHSQVRDGAVDALLKMGPAAKEVVPTLIRALDDESWTVRSTAAEVLGSIGPDAGAAVPALMRALRYERPADRKTGVACAGKSTGGKEPTEWSCSSDPDSNWESDVVVIRRTAAQALGNIGPKARPAVPLLMKSLRDAHPKVRRQAAAALGKIGPAARIAVPALTEALQDKDAGVRDNANNALRKIRKVAE